MVVPATIREFSRAWPNMVEPSKHLGVVLQRERRRHQGVVKNVGGAAETGDQHPVERRQAVGEDQRQAQVHRVGAPSALGLPGRPTAVLASGATAPEALGAPESVAALRRSEMVIGWPRPSTVRRSTVQRLPACGAARPYSVHRSVAGEDTRKQEADLGCR
jgi:hypothetical protein